MLWCTILWLSVPVTAMTINIGRRPILENAAAGAALVMEPGVASASSTKLDSENIVTLSDGCQFPVVSFGLQVYDDDKARRYTLTALEAGYRNFFASVLAGNQRGFAKAIQESGIDRDELFICGSVLSNRAQGFDAARKVTRRGCNENIQDLGLIPDQIMLDYPGPDPDSIRGQWTAFEEMKENNQVKSLAVSNFSPSQLDVILKNNDFSIHPAVNQLPFGVGFKPGTNKRLLEENKQRNVLIQAWSPLRTVGPTSKALCADIGKKYGKSPQQVALRWILQRGATYTTQSTKQARIVENGNVFDFSLSKEDMKLLDLVQG